VPDKFNAEFLAKRCLALKEFLRLVTENKRLLEATALKDFLTVDAIGNVTVDSASMSVGSEWKLTRNMLTLFCLFDCLFVLVNFFRSFVC
jgi:hypothetical protein